MAAEVESPSSSSLSQLLETIQTSLSSAIPSLPSAKSPDEDEATHEASIVPPSDGISLLDTKSEIILSYLQNLVFLILLQVRQLPKSTKENGSAKNDTQVQEEVSRKLVELRVYLERGVKPLEGRLKYQIDKVLKAAEDAQRTQQQKPTKIRRNSAGSDSEVSNSGSEDGSGSEDSDEEDQDVDELAYRPNLAAFSRAAASKQDAKPKSSTKAEPSDGIYRPPKIKPTALPPPESDRRPREQRKQTSRVIDEFVQAEMSSAPMVEPSIGSTIRAGGRVVKTQRDREKEAERSTYEETNLVRLPKESKKERAKRGARERTGFGGEDWKSLGAGADRIQRLTKRGKESGSGGGVLERSRKRRATEDGPRGDGVNVGDGFEKRRKKVAGWKQ